MVGSDAAIQAARDWIQRVYPLRDLVEKPHLGREIRTAQVTTANQKRDAYYAITRHELGIADL